MLQSKRSSCCGAESGADKTNCCTPAPDTKSTGCCSTAIESEAGCCPSVSTKKQLLIDFLYLDLSVCERCQGTDQNLDDALSDVSAVLHAAGFEVLVNKVNIINKELANQYKFMSSPTIRVNGRDIAVDVKENSCTSCGDLCGDSVDCRVFTYEGSEYNTPPKAMIINAILGEVYGAKSEPVKADGEYVLPENLRIFFEGQERR